jgi:hypothetical protein
VAAHARLGAAGLGQGRRPGHRRPGSRLAASSVMTRLSSWSRCATPGVEALSAAIATLAEREVIAFMSDSHLKPDDSVEVFVLAS